MQTFSQIGPSEIFFIARRDNPCTRLVYYYYRLHLILGLKYKSNLDYKIGYCSSSCFDSKCSQLHLVLVIAGHSFGSQEDSISDKTHLVSDWSK